MLKLNQKFNKNKLNAVKEYSISFEECQTFEGRFRQKIPVLLKKYGNIIEEGGIKTPPLLRRGSKH